MRAGSLAVRRSLRRLGGSAGVLVLAFVSIAADGHPGKAKQPRQAKAGPTVLVRTTGNRSENRETIPITRRTGEKKFVVMSMGTNKLPSLIAHDRLKVSSELQVTDDCNDPEPRCAGKPYQWNP